EINEGGFGPKAALNFFARDDGSRTLGEEQQQTERLRLKFYENTGFAEFTGGRIQLERAEAEVRQVGQAGWDCDHKLTKERRLPGILSVSREVRHWNYSSSNRR